MAMESMDVESSGNGGGGGVSTVVKVLIAIGAFLLVAGAITAAVILTLPQSYT